MLPPSVEAELAKLPDVHYVGGCVRDSLLGLPAADYDVATYATPERVKELLSVPVLDTGVKYGTVTAVFDTYKVEVTTFRTSSGGFSKSLLEDLSNRDFTVNAMAMSLSGDVVDPYGGHADLKSRVLRGTGDVVRPFRDDALRMIRAARLAAKLGFTIDPDTLQAMREHGGWLRAVEPERVYAEFTKAFKLERPERFIHEMYASDLMGHALAVSGEHTILSKVKMVELMGAVKVFRGAFGLDIMWAAYLTGRMLLAYSNESITTQTIPEFLPVSTSRFAVDFHQAVMSFYLILGVAGNYIPTKLEQRIRITQHRALKQLKDPHAFMVIAAMCKVLYGTSTPVLDTVFTLRDNITPILTGDDLLALGIPQGPVLGKLLDDAAEYQATFNIQSKSNLLDRVQQAYIQGKSTLAVY